MEPTLTISYEQFAALTIQIGTIIAVEVVPDADKLLRLMVDIGEPAPRQIISGIRMYVDDPATLVGRQFPFLTNLAPRVIRGFESQGMILAASSGDVFAFLDPSVPLPPGTKIK
jgi:methionyl-tRNA synthetase